MLIILKSRVKYIWYSVFRYKYGSRSLRDLPLSLIRCSTDSCRLTKQLGAPTPSSAQSCLFNTTKEDFKDLPVVREYSGQLLNQEERIEANRVLDLDYKDLVLKHEENMDVRAWLKAKPMTHAVKGLFLVVKEGVSYNNPPMFCVGLPLYMGNYSWLANTERILYKRLLELWGCKSEQPGSLEKPFSY